MVRTKKNYDAYYWLALTILFFAVTVCNVVFLFCRSSSDHTSFFAALGFLAVLFAVSPLFFKTAAGLLREYQFASSEITEYSVFRRKRAIPWGDYPYAYIVWMGPMFRLPHSCTHYFLFAKKRLPSRIKKEKDKDPSHYFRSPKEYIIFGYSEDLEQKIREMHPEIRFVKRDLR